MPMVNSNLVFGIYELFTKKHLKLMWSFTLDVNSYLHFWGCFFIFLDFVQKKSFLFTLKDVTDIFLYLFKTAYFALLRTSFYYIIFNCIQNLYSILLQGFVYWDLLVSQNFCHILFICWFRSLDASVTDWTEFMWALSSLVNKDLSVTASNTACWI